MTIEEHIKLKMAKCPLTIEQEHMLLLGLENFLLEKESLLPCPFCGKMPYECGNHKGQYVARCYNCGVVMTHDRIDKLKGIWNNRKNNGQ